MNDLMHKFRSGVSLTNKELKTLETELEYYAGETIPKDSWFHNNLSSMQLRLLKDGAYSSLLTVRDIIKARENK